MADSTEPATAPEGGEPAAVHELENSWCFWEHRKGGGNAYTDQMHRLGEFCTVEDFWRYLNNIPKPSEVFYTSTSGSKRFADRTVDGFSLFKKGIRPEWEDPQNMHGGEWSCRKTFPSQELDTLWENLVLGMIGENIDDGDEVCGARIVDKSKGDRAMYRLELWFRSQDAAVMDDLQNGLLTALSEGQPGRCNIKFDFRSHGEALHHVGGGGGGGGGRGGGGRGGGGRSGGGRSGGRKR